MHFHSFFHYCALHLHPAHLIAPEPADASSSRRLFQPKTHRSCRETNKCVAPQNHSSLLQSPNREIFRKKPFKTLLKSIFGTSIPFDCHLQQVGDGFVVLVQLVLQPQDSTPFHHTVLAKCFDWVGGKRKTGFYIINCMIYCTGRFLLV